MFDYFEQESERPSWISENNSSITVYNALIALIEQKKDFINSHRYVTHFKSKNSYQITGREVARKAGLSSTTVLRSSTYSGDFMRYLNDVVNPDLVKLKNERVEKFGKAKKPRGRYESTKSHLVEVAGSLSLQLKVLEKRDAEKDVNAVINRLRPEIRKLLFI